MFAIQADIHVFLNTNLIDLVVVNINMRAMLRTFSCTEYNLDNLALNNEEAIKTHHSMLELLF